jgi:hypothetical protein
VLHVQVFVPGPVDWQLALASQPPLLVTQLLIGVHVFPLPA